MLCKKQLLLSKGTIFLLEKMFITKSSLKVGKVVLLKGETYVKVPLMFVLNALL